MRVLTTVSQVSEAVSACRRPLGLVPTMGALHEGHLSLVRKARAENDSLAATIFVNPAQFAATEDLGEYPRSRDQDLDLLRREGVDLVFVPSEDEVYPPGFTSWVDLPGMGDRLEGAHRPGHFRGVATVVTKLLSMVRPDQGLLRPKRWPTGGNHPPSQSRPEPGSGNHRLPNRPGTRRPGFKQPQLLP